MEDLVGFDTNEVEELPRRKGGPQGTLVLISEYSYGLWVIHNSQGWQTHTYLVLSAQAFREASQEHFCTL